MNFKTEQSVINKLFKRSFSVYIFIAIIVTFFHLAGEYRLIKMDIEENIIVLNKTFSPIAVKALWQYESSGINLVLEGILNNPDVIGVKIINSQDSELFGTGVILDEKKKAQRISGTYAASLIEGGLFNNPIWFHFPINKQDGTLLGELTIYSSTRFILERIQYSFLLIFFNAIIKSLALWAIFYWFSRKLLRQRFELLNQSVQRIHQNRKDHLSADEEDLLGLKDEFGTLARNLDKLRNGISEKVTFLEQKTLEIGEQMKRGAEQLDKKTRHIGNIMNGVSQMVVNMADDNTGDLKDGPNPVIPIEIDKVPYLIPINCVSYIQVEQHYVSLQYRSGNEWLIWNTFGTLNDYEQKYPGLFLRINRSTLINPINSIRIVTKNNQIQVVMNGIDKPTFPISKSRYKIIKSNLPQLEE